jgi:calcium-dependent protein kinase
MFIEKVGKSEKEAEYAAKFKALDKNQDGFLSEDELKEGLVNEFEDIIDGDQEDLEQLMREVNKNKDGQLNYLDFIKALRYKGLMQ